MKPELESFLVLVFRPPDCAVGAGRYTRHHELILPSHVKTVSDSKAGGKSIVEGTHKAIAA
jgi:hypothetical protein